ncbi:MAG TPA: alpha/beta fold hydrolase [Candidatus Nanopelagicales bacterium]
MGLPVVLLPGAGLPAGSAYRDLLAALGEGISPVLVDLELFADEVPPPGYCLDLEVAAVAAAADAAGFDGFHLVGFSAGGAVALAFAAHAPARVRSLALIEPAWAGNEGLAAEEQALWAAFSRAMALPVEDRMAEFRRLHMPPGVPPPPAGPAPAAAWAARRPRGLPTLIAAFARQRLDLDALRSLAGPTLVVVGSRSNPDYFAREAGRLVDVLPDWEVELFAERHHFDPPHQAEAERVARSLHRLWARGPHGW